MTAQTEFVGKTFDQVFESFQTATESALQMQNDCSASGRPYGRDFRRSNPKESRSFNSFRKNGPEP